MKLCDEPHSFGDVGCYNVGGYSFGLFFCAACVCRNCAAIDLHVLCLVLVFLDDDGKVRCDFLLCARACDR